MRVERLPIDTFEPSPYNPRRDLLPGDREWREIERSLDEFGLVEPLVGNEATGRLVGGHQRLKILRAKGETHAYFSVVSVPDERREKALNVRLNAAQGAWEWPRLADLFEDDAQLAELAGFGEADLAALRLAIDEDVPAGMYDQLERIANRPAASERGADDPGPRPDKAGELSAEYGVEVGQVWQVGQHRLACGDATEARLVERALGGLAPALTATDPPYGVGVDHRWRIKALGGQWAGARGPIVGDDRFDWTDALLLSRSDVLYLWHGSLFACEAIQSIAKAGYELRAQIIWRKPSAFTRGAYHWQHESCWYAVRKGATANWVGDRKQTTVWDATPPNYIYASTDRSERTDHPTQKPVELWAIPIQNHTTSGDVVYDPFVGSGTALVACEQSERVGVGIDLDPRWVAVTLDRLVRMGCSAKLAE